MAKKQDPEKIVREIKRRTRRKFSSEDDGQRPRRK